ncbi:hypothetical protein FP435_00170 (plasmid) [Lactobacillus sp. PV037]|uniref:hypothetical protein n=1 Tax=Lactobacillus sp. PV037 TaxID=2594496 RepID=UPI00223EB84F|nr:hypothetical protein [Lactobacillus sp. PV037]QNQ82953.1 hypothetical protein FP435_00170 [Lactobacillus sp. PV037]
MAKNKYHKVNTQTRKFLSSRNILIGTIVMVVILFINSLIMHNSWFITILVPAAIGLFGFLIYRNATNPGEFSKKVNQVGFFKAVIATIKGNPVGRRDRDIRNRRRR